MYLRAAGKDTSCLRLLVTSPVMSCYHQHSIQSTADLDLLAWSGCDMSVSARFAIYSSILKKLLLHAADARCLHPVELRLVGI